MWVSEARFTFYCKRARHASFIVRPFLKYQWVHLSVDDLTLSNWRVGFLQTDGGRREEMTSRLW